MVALGRLLFGGEHRHVTVDDLHRDVLQSGMQLSLATVYNTLNQFADAGLVRKVAVNGGRSYFDTDAGDHQHFYVEAEDRIFDVPEDSITFGSLPPPPHGYEIAGVDVVIRLVPTSARRLHRAPDRPALRQEPPLMNRGPPMPEPTD